jgi:hypothetical protein
MPHQFLHHLQFRTRCTEKCRVGSAKCVPTNALCDAQPLRRGGGCGDEEVVVPNMGFFLVSWDWRTPNSPVNEIPKVGGLHHLYTRKAA